MSSASFNIKNNKLIIIICLFSITLRCLIAAHSYSGETNAPEFGDYEAQRHWMEITYWLEPKQWYVNGTNNNLSYWGLDYPPLTAYVAKLHAMIGYLLVPKMIELNTSHGNQSDEGKFFMRHTVISSDIFLFIPIMLLVIRNLYDGDVRNWTRLDSPANTHAKWFLLLLSQPALLLIDHGHFQYNGIGLALLAAAVVAVSGGRFAVGTILYCLSLNYKHMALYFAPAFFTYVLSSLTIRRRSSVGLVLFDVARLGAVFLLTMCVLWWPFLPKPTVLRGTGLSIFNDDATWQDTWNVLTRLFPWERGLYEDKVANIWCTISPVFKMQKYFDVTLLRRICTLSTLLLLLPSNYRLWRRPTRRRFVQCLIATSMSFFFASYHVHEKSFLYPLLAINLWFPFDPLAVLTMNVTATFSMYPLLAKDGLQIPYASLMILCALWCLKESVSVGVGRVRRAIVASTFVAIGAIHFFSAWPGNPAHLPFLWQLLCTSFSFCYFFIFFIYVHGYEGN